MELIALYILGVINLALVWYLHTLQEDMYWERENAKEERGKLFSHAAQERKDLYDRLQAGTLPSYKEHVEASNELEPEEEETVVSLDEAKEELMNDATL